MEKIITALDYAKRDGCKSVRDHIEMRLSKAGKRYETPIKGNAKGKAIKSLIDFGRWIAICPDCKGAEDVDPSEPIFYCFSCGNYKNNGHPRPVEFPQPAAYRENLEREILKRPIEEGTGTNALDRAANAKAKVRTEEGLLSRSWLPGETLDDIKEQNKPLKG